MYSAIAGSEWVDELYTLSQLAASATHMDAGLKAILNHMTKGFGAASATLALMDEGEGKLRIESGTDLPEEAIGTQVALGQGVLGCVAQEGRPRLINGRLTTSANAQRKRLRRLPSSSMCWPLQIKNRLIGVLSVNRFDGQTAFDEADLQRGAIMVNMLALMVDNLRMHRDQLQRIATLSRLNDEMAQMNERLSQTQAQLMQSEKMASIGQLAAGVAHEINNPVGYVTSNVGMLESYVELLLKHISQTALPDAVNVQVQEVVKDVPDLIHETREGLDRVRKIVQDLKDFSRVDTTDEWEWADLNAGLQSTLNIGLSEIKYKAQVHTQFQALPLVQCLPSQLNQVFLNLLVNASQAISQQGNILIRTGVQGEQVWITIEDDGQGIAEENLTRIFDPFYTTKAIGKGTGLGLSLSYAIVKKHHGQITVQSTVGQGSVFRVTLPVQQPAEPGGLHEPATKSAT